MPAAPSIVFRVAEVFFSAHCTKKITLLGAAEQICSQGDTCKDPDICQCSVIPFHLASVAVCRRLRRGLPPRGVIARCVSPTNSVSGHISSVYGSRYLQTADLARPRVCTLASRDGLSGSDLAVPQYQWLFVVRSDQQCRKWELIGTVLGVRHFHWDSAPSPCHRSLNVKNLPSLTYRTDFTD